MQGKPLFKFAVGQCPQILVHCIAANITFLLIILTEDARTVFLHVTDTFFTASLSFTS